MRNAVLVMVAIVVLAGCSGTVEPSSVPDSGNGPHLGQLGDECSLPGDAGNNADGAKPCGPGLVCWFSNKCVSDHWGG